MSSERYTPLGSAIEEISIPPQTERARLEPRATPRFRSWLLAALIVLGVLGAALAFWSVYSLGVNTGRETAAPVLTPDGPAKVAPQEPGGIEIPNQDKLVYNRIGPNAPEEEVERLLPPPQIPTPPVEQEPAATNATTPATTQWGPPATAETQSPPQSAPQSKVTPPPAAAPRSTAPAAVSATPKATPKGDWEIQLGALREESVARAVWERLRKQRPELLGSLSPQISRIAVEGKGVFYRLRGGPLPDKAAADRLCAALARDGVVSCFAAQKR